MTEQEMDKAHEAYQAFDAAVVAAGQMILLHLNDEQREYVVTKMHDEFRFWRIAAEAFPEEEEE